MKLMLWIIFFLLSFAILTALPPSPSWGPLRKRYQNEEDKYIILETLSKMNIDWVGAKPRIDRGLSFSGEIEQLPPNERQLLSLFYANPCLETAGELFISNPKRWFATFTVYGPEPDDELASNS